MHAFVDESFRGREYLVCAVVLSPSVVGDARKAMRGMLQGSQGRVHMTKENVKVKRALIERVTSLGITATVVMVAASGSSQRACRDRCLDVLSHQLHSSGVTRIVIESCDQDKADLQVVNDELARCNRLRQTTVLHHRPSDDPLLWIADIVAWAYGRGGEWRRRLQPLALNEIRA